METRSLGRRGPRVSRVGFCLPEGAAGDALAERARARGCTFLLRGGPPADAPFGLVPYNLLDHKEANEAIPALVRQGTGVVATRVLAGGALSGKVVHAPFGARVAELGFLVKPGRTLAQAAVQFVLANESVDAALVRVSSGGHLDEIWAAPEAPSLTGRELEQIFELWANRFG